MVKLLTVFGRRVARIVNGLALQVRIVFALADRDFFMRAEKGSFGFWGVLFEPLALMLTLLALRILVKMKSVDLINPLIWLACGVTMLFLFKKIAIKALTGVAKGQKMFFYRRIRPLDTLLASALIEARLHASILVLIFISESFWFWRIQLDDPGLALIDFIVTVMLAIGIGVSALVIGHRIPIVKTLTKFGLNRVLLWTSGIFFATYTLPGPTRPLVTWNPLLHSVEILRHSINNAYPIPDISLDYLLTCAFLSCGFGLIFYFSNEALLLSDD